MFLDCPSLLSFLLPVELADTELNVRVILESTARVHQQLVHPPVLQLSLVDQGADLSIKVEAAGPVEVEDLIKAEPAPVEEELRGETVRDDAVAVLGHRLRLLQSEQLRSAQLRLSPQNDCQ